VVHSVGLGKCIMTCFHHCSVILSSFTDLKILCAPQIFPSLTSPLNLGNHWSFYLLHSLPFPCLGLFEAGLVCLKQVFGWEVSVSSSFVHQAWLTALQVS
jgi:hypothetical protein